MKVTLAFFAALLAVGMCATVQMLIHHEVVYLYSQDHDMTVDHCTTKCDALFDLIAGHDEDRTDRLCHYECLCQKNNNCHTITASPQHVHRTTTSAPAVDQV
ncbi:hypothetical protein EGW08_017603 [Elysia chlorotica]|uniref:Uncharacterized protein n=1 Tax=Elysia chlorotica TaxID=188477 RepID=A0A3S0ZGY3_ELYCH|nr:hypothetical protein EGW08_017603 [Elysia chlorotica]